MLACRPVGRLRKKRIEKHLIYALSVLLSGVMRGVLKNLWLVLVIAGGCFANIYTYVDQPEDNLILDKQTLRSEFFINHNHLIRDLDVVIKITHPHIYDLTIWLEKDGGPTVMLNYYELGEFFFGTNYDVVLDDEAVVPINEARLPLAGTYQPRDGEVLSAFDGYNAYGVWTLCVQDSILGDEGTLDSWGLVVTNPEPATIFLLGVGMVFLRKKL
jgi:hypothetical protein